MLMTAVSRHRTTSAPSEQAALERAISSPAGNDATDIVAFEVDGDDSPLSSAPPEVVRLPLWDDLGRVVLQLELQRLAQVHSELRS